MAQQLHLYQRLSHKWAPGWSHLEDEKFLLTAKALYGPSVEDPNGDSITDEHIQSVCIKLPPHDFKPSQIRNALYAQFSGTSCRHEYDCCGCWCSSATVEQKDHRHWSVKIRSYRNY